MSTAQRRLSGRELMRLALTTTYLPDRPALWRPAALRMAATAEGYAAPDDSVGAVNGDLNQRRGRLLGMEPQGGMTTIRAEVPMAEMLTYAQSLTSLTGGRGDYHMSFARYEEVPTHIAQKLIEQTRKEREEAKV